MNETKLQDRLHDLASKMPVDLERSAPRTLRRARARRGAVAFVASAAVVAIVVGGTAVLRVAAPEGSDGREPVVPATDSPSPGEFLPPSPAPFAGLWPETTPEALAEAQAQVDDGHHPLRLDPAQTAAMLATNLLGWRYDDTRPEIVAASDEVTTVGLTNSTLGDAVPPISVDVAQLGRTGPDGIWSVVGVSSPMIAHVTVHPPLDDGLRIGIEGNTRDRPPTAAVLYEIRSRGALSDELLACCPADVDGDHFTGDWSIETMDVNDSVLWVIVLDSRGPQGALGATAVDLEAFELPVPEPTGDAAPPSSDFGDLPPDVAVTAQRILDAASAHDVGALGELVVPDLFSYNFGAVEDPVAAWAEDPSALDPVGAILSLPNAVEEIEGTTYYVWPYLMEDGALDEISDAERNDLHALGFTDEELEQMREFGAYLGPRLGIDQTGAWRYYVTGGD